MTKSTTSFVYVTYIASTPEKVFEAITKPDLAGATGATRTSLTGSPDRRGSKSAPATSARSNSSARSSRPLPRPVSSSAGQARSEPTTRPPTAE